MTATATPLPRAERLDRLPFTREHGRLVVGSGLGWALDAMDVGLISFVMAALAVQWQLSPTELSWIGSIGFAGMALGATLGGLLADRFGRRQVFAITLLIFGLATGAAALSWSVGALLVFRFLIGLGLGAELPVASTLVSEFAPARVRGRVVVLLEAFWAVGWTLSALIGYFVVPRSDAGWRWALAIGALPALYAVVVRRGLPESVRFLELRGRVDEAEAAVRRFERAAGVAPVESPPVEPTAPPGPRALWAAGTRVRTAALWVVWFSINFAYYGAFIWLPTLLVANGFSLVRSFGYTLVITLAQLPGYAVAAFLIEKWGRRATLATFLAGSALGAGLFAAADGETAVPHRHGAVVLQPRRLGRPVRGDAGGLPDRSPRDRGRRRGGLRATGLDRRAALRAAAAGRRRNGAGLRHVRGLLRRRRAGHVVAARAPRSGPRGRHRRTPRGRGALRLSRRGPGGLLPSGPGSGRAWLSSPATTSRG
ncbi:MFS transporter [Blastococcus mobilis]|uniref:MFS transporter, putative metabolite:H+ symporter n=1 Tax=Blastococcus mobilis TaxID=1938746 RepID=A0A238XI92_9ACTN|nr:MFS transporter, putative metabolite:H+ symporter [Blastococcus mobilis]